MQRRRRPWWQWTLAGPVGLAALVGAFLAVWKLPLLLYGDVTKASADARLQAASGFRTALIAGVAGLVALGSLVVARRTYRLTQEGQITDRYTKAIEQLGSDKPDVRLGGIYALERIAKDSPQTGPLLPRCWQHSSVVVPRGRRRDRTSQARTSRSRRSASCAIERPMYRRH